MKKETLIKLRTILIILFSVSLVFFVITMFMDGSVFFLLAACLAFCSMSGFLFTEAFLYSPEERTLFNLWIARLFFVLTVPIIIAIVFALLRLMN